MPRALRAWAEHVIAASAVLLAVVLAHAPHADDPRPLHVDEWFHMAHAEALVEARSTDYVEPFYGLEENADELEVGFHVLMAWARVAAGVDPLLLMEWWPAVVHGLAVLMAHALGRRLGFGPWGGVLLALVPTNVSILGPAFVVPVALALPGLVLALGLVLVEGPQAWRLACLGLLLAFLFLAHAPTGAGASLLAVVAAAAHDPPRLRERAWPGWRSVALVAGTCVLASLAFVARYPALVGGDVGAVASGEGSLFGEARPGVVAALRDFGVWTLVLFLAGVFAALSGGGAAGRALAAGAVAFFGIVYAGRLLSFGSGFLYLRGYQYFFVTASLLGGVALARAAALPRRQALALALPLLLAAPAVAHAATRDIPYYHVTTDADAERFAFAGALGDEYGVAVLDPWKARAFAPLTGKHVYAILPPRDDPDLAHRIEAARRAATAGDVDEAEMRAANVTLFLGARPKLENVLEPHPGVFVWCDPARTFRTAPCAGS